MKKLFLSVGVAVVIVCMSVITGCAKGHVHDYGAYEVLIPSTCTNEGSEQAVCKQDSTHTVTRKIQKKEHTFSDWEVFWEDGQQYRTCSACQYKESKQQKQYKITYQLNFGTLNADAEYFYDKADGCALPTPEKEGYKFAGWREGGVDGAIVESIVGGSEGDKELFAEYELLNSGLIFRDLGEGYDVSPGTEIVAENITLPKYYNNKSVIVVNDFSDCTSIERISLPETIVAIADRAFVGCTKLESIIVPPSVSTFPATAFEGTAFWTNAPDNSIVYAGTWAIGVKGTVPELKFKSGTVGIGDFAFTDNITVSSVNLAGIKYVGYGAFWGCTQLTELTDCSTVWGIGSMSFADCAKLTSVDNFTAAEIIRDSAFTDSAAFVPKNGVDYIGGWAIKGGEDLREIVLEAGTVGIADSAFSYNATLGKVNLNGAQVIGFGAFEKCKSLFEVIGTQNLKIIEAYAFSGCVLLADIGSIENVTLINVFAFNDTAIVNNAPDGLVYYQNWCIATKGELPKVLRFAKDTVGVCGLLLMGWQGEALYIPKSVQFIGSQMMYCDCAPATIYVETAMDNPRWRSDWNIMFEVVYGYSDQA